MEKSIGNDTGKGTSVTEHLSPETENSQSEHSTSGTSSPYDVSQTSPSRQCANDNSDDPQVEDEVDYHKKLQSSLMRFAMDDTEEVSSESSACDSTTASSSSAGPSSAPTMGDDNKTGAFSDGGGSTAESEDGSMSSLAEEQLKMALPDLLSDVAKFAYSSLVAVCLPNLFDNQLNKQWNLKTLKALWKYLKLPKQSLQTLAVMLQDPSHHDPENRDIFRGVLVDDPSLIKPDMIPKDMIMQALSEGAYDARMRVLAKEIAKVIDVPWEIIRDFERGIVDCYKQQEHELSEEEKRERDKKSRIRKAKKIAMIGAATVGGGVIIGLTGGLAAPLIASAGAALLGTSLGFFGTVAGAAILGSILGAAGAGLSGYKMKKRVGEVEEFEFTALTAGRDLHVTIAVSGWLTKDRLDNFTAPWQRLANSEEVYCLKWESKHLLALGEALKYILDSVMTMAAKEALKYTVLSGLLAAIALPAAAYSLISSSIDNPWSIATSRASETGKQLAEVLLSRQQGKRPVTLVGFSMGARVVFFCLQELAQRKGGEGLVQDAYLLGAPVPSDVSRWSPFAKVVAGRIVNGYCRGDWLLQFVYRTASMQVSDIAGLEPIRWRDRRMVNVDLTDIVTGHLDYSDKMDAILEFVGLEMRERQMSSSDLSQLTNPRGKVASERGAERGVGEEAQDALVEEGYDALPLTIDASDLLIPKSASAVDLALAKQEGTLSETPSKPLSKPILKGGETNGAHPGSVPQPRTDDNATSVEEQHQGEISPDAKGENSSTGPEDDTSAVGHEECDTIN